ncbi:Trm112 family protein [Amycolatopsis sp. cg5]|uniref:Trm112 family protein n=1 Tax=Amycolatopsis sp. cg5 TaxID=3238802 RepID=UPI0035252790
MAVTLDAQLLEILACPSPDHAPLRAGSPGDPEADALTCTECGRVYPVRDGIPVLLLDEATAPEGSETSSADGA